MLHIVLYQPEIPPNTGNIIRLCANSGAKLHLIQPLGFNLNNKHLKRAGLDYHALAEVEIHKNYQQWLQNTTPNRIISCSTKATTSYADIKYQDNDALLFGPETRGLPEELIFSLPANQQAKIPMLANNRSLNLWDCRNPKIQSKLSKNI